MITAQRSLQVMLFVRFDVPERTSMDIRHNSIFIVGRNPGMPSPETPSTDGTVRPSGAEERLFLFTAIPS
ncbi:hypothetical protein MVEN_02225200 [Mycena venus]|uniref:Uncharacterized protein n=1 Tax=Mycena venus TaxID=2733690 RepID=A0A8H7CH21_9AGAR|nr:hypothetical protein MVEN_02225200 [Mycena venus]